MKPTLPVVTLTLTVALFSFARGAQAQGVDGEIQGLVVDLSNAALPDVVITIINTATGAARVVRTDLGGHFSAPALKVGPYEATAELNGFVPRRHEDLRVSVGESLALRFELRPATDTETIAVGDRPLTLDPTRSHPAALLEEPVVRNLPVKSRNVVDLVPTVPDVVRDLSSGTIVISGQPGNANRMSVDGGELIDFGSYQFSSEAVEEVRVDMNGYRAEYGRASGGVVHVVTKSGTNAMRGSAVAFAGGAEQAGAVFGGPIVRDRHFFLVNADTLQSSRDQRVFLVKTDSQLTGSSRLMFRYNDHDLQGGVANQSTMVGFTAVLGSRIVNDSRIHYAQADGLLPLNRLQVADSLTWTGAGHEIKVGFDAISDADLRFGDIVSNGFSSENVSEFVQDQFRVGSALTFNVGARHDISDQWDPRVGLTVMPRARFLMRGSYGRFSSPLTNLSMQQGSAGFEWEWMPKTTIGVNALGAGASGRDYRAVTAEVARRFWQGTEYRVAYTFGRNTGRIPVAYEPGSRFVTSLIYDTQAFAARFRGAAEKILTDWTVSGVFAVQTIDPRLGAADLRYSSFDPRIARNISFGSGRTLALILESYNLLDRPNMVAIIDPLYPVGAGQREGRVTQIGARLSF